MTGPPNWAARTVRFHADSGGGMVIFADTSGDARFLLITFLATTIGAAGQYVVTQALKLRSERKSEGDQKEKSILDRQDAYIKRLEGDAAEHKKELAATSAQVIRYIDILGKCRNRAARMKWAIRTLEGTLERNKLSFEKYTEDDEDDSDTGSATHTPITPK